MNEHTRIVEAQKEYLPAKAKRANYPHFLWIQLPYHKNFRNNKLKNSFYKCMDIVGKKVWEENNSNFFVSDAQRYTAEGLNKYWETIDHTVRFCYTTILKRIAKLEIKASEFATREYQRIDWYEWTKKNDRNHHSPADKKHSETDVVNVRSYLWSVTVIHHPNK